MAKVGRPGLSIAKRFEIWLYWGNGESSTEIGRQLGIETSSVLNIVDKNGGIVPTPRKRSKGVLSFEEREEISRGIAKGISFREIARRVKRTASTVSREIGRNGGREKYRALEADSRTWERALRPKQCRLAQKAGLRRKVTDKLKEDWSPEQISGWLKKEYAADKTMQVSHETIYRSLYIQARGVLKKELTKHLRTKRKRRNSKKAPSKRATRGQIIDAVSIRERGRPR